MGSRTRHHNGRTGKTWKAAKITEIYTRERTSKRTGRTFFTDYAILDCGHEKLVPASDRYEGTYRTMHCLKTHN